MEFILDTSPASRDLAFLEDKLLSFNGNCIHGYAYENFLYKVRDNSKAITAGIHGQTGGGWLYIAALWVKNGLRRQRMGTRLLLMAEKTAIDRGCHSAFLYTYSFQTPQFYLRQGYGEFGRLDNFCGGHARLYMQKKLT
ncbi:MAG: GNAT family N-acetyltransferase [Desulfobacteraceae bacterium]|nr:GNAT family N-acetyltransferase [Desulfobacteraceae bacterium]